MSAQAAGRRETAVDRLPIAPLTGVALRVWHGSLALRCKTDMLFTVDCRRASQQCGSAT